MTLRWLSVCLLAALVPAADVAEPGRGHVAAHGGCLNEIGACENGHAEVKVEGTRLRLWFVGGGQETRTAVRIPDASVTLAIAANGSAPARTITLAAKPLLLAEERDGDCSYFEGSADWLAGLAGFHATGAITFRGARTTLVIDWPAGSDPDHQPAGR